VKLLTTFVALACFEILPAEEKNRLANEKSPYLLLHADNPVDWYPWGKEAFAKARKENKPILLSIGYSSCHWCHVMERESFQNKELAAYINNHFVAVKLDREERPDLDQLYMTTYQAMTGKGGGWPLNAFLTPDLKMFTGVTYVPPKAKPGVTGFDSVLKQIHEAWGKDSEKIKKDVNNHYLMLAKSLQQGATPKPGTNKVAIAKASAKLMKTFDRKNGGWRARGPKFMQPANLRLMLVQWKQSKDKSLLDAVELTAIKMAHGGVYDHLAGGFHRYSVDGEWLVPHFEKVLYDQAQLLDLYLELWQITGKVEYKRIAKDIAGYVMREMQGEHGGYFCAQNSESEGKEGKFACWTLAELKKLLNDAELELVVKHFGLSEKGNFFDFSDPKALKGQNVLSLPLGRKLETGEQSKVLAAAIEKMRAVRRKRVPAATDDKVLASWNGLMIGAMARAGVAFGEERYLKSATRAYEAVRGKLWDGATLYHRWRDGERDDTQQVSSYLWMTHAARSLYQATLNTKYLDQAVVLVNRSIEVFGDKKNGGFFGAAASKDIVLRLKADHDGAIPVATSVGAIELAHLASITGKPEFMKAAQACIDSQGAMINQAPEALSYLLRAVVLLEDKHAKLVVAGQPGHGATALLTAAAKHYSPALIVSGNQGDLVAEFAKSLPAKDGKATAYICVGQVCKEPVTEPKKLGELMK